MFLLLPHISPVRPSHSVTPWCHNIPKVSSGAAVTRCQVLFCFLKLHIFLHIWQLTFPHLSWDAVLHEYLPSPQNGAGVSEDVPCGKYKFLHPWVSLSHTHWEELRWEMRSHVSQMEGTPEWDSQWSWGCSTAGGWGWITEAASWTSDKTWSLFNFTILITTSCYWSNYFPGIRTYVTHVPVAIFPLHYPAAAFTDTLIIYSVWPANFHFCVLALNAIVG